MAFFCRGLPGVLQRTHDMKDSIPQANRLALHHTNQRVGTFPDFEISHHGTLSLFHPLTDRAHKWLGCHCPPDQEHQYLRKALAIEHRFVASIICFAINDGLIQTATTQKGR
jgi:hypothetical protein